MMTRTAVAWIGCMCLVLAFAVASPATAAQSGERDSESGSDKGTEGTEKSEPKPSPGKVYTNEDLARLSGSEPEPQTGAPESATTAGEAARPAERTDTSDTSDTSDTQEEKSALDQLLEREALREQHKQSVAEAEQRVAAARQRITDLEKRELAIKNPFLARPKAPEEGAEEWEGADGPGRVKQTESQLQAARDELAEAERELAELRRSAP